MQWEGNLILLLLIGRNINLLRDYHSDIPFPHNDTFSCPWETNLLKTLWEKGEIAHNEQFLLFPVFSTRLDNFLPFSSNLKMSSANSFILEESKICRLVMGYD